MDHKMLQGPVSVSPSSLIWKHSPPCSLCPPASWPPRALSFVFLESHCCWLLLTLYKSALLWFLHECLSRSGLELSFALYSHRPKLLHFTVFIIWHLALLFFGVNLCLHYHYQIETLWAETMPKKALYQTPSPWHSEKEFLNTFAEVIHGYFLLKV